MGGNIRKTSATVPGSGAGKPGIRLPGILPCLLLIAILGGAGTSSGENALTKTLPEMPDSVKRPIPVPFISKIGLEAGFVGTRDFDTGVDFGALIGRDFYRDFFEVTTMVHLWGATNDTLDVATAAVDLSFCYKIPIRPGVIGFAGFVAGYGFVHSEKEVSGSGGTVRTTDSRHDFQKFVITGAEFDIHKNRTAFIQLKFGTTRLAREIHVTGGMNFYTKNKKFIPWLAPPLLRD